MKAQLAQSKTGSSTPVLSSAALGHGLQDSIIKWLLCNYQERLKDNIKHSSLREFAQ